nr:hypothetical protein [Tanacetum cinerariifolium]
MESDEVIKSSDKNLVPIQSESEVTFDNEKELNAEIADTILKSLSSFPIPVKDSDSQMEEIDLFLATDDLVPPGIEYDDYDSKEDIHFLKELLRGDPFPLPKNDSSNFDHHDNSSFPRPPPEPSDVEIFFDFEPDTSVLTTKVVEDISKQYVLMPKVLRTQPTLCPNINTLLRFSSENEDKVFKPEGISLSWMFRISISILLDQAQVWGIESGSRL